MSYFSDLYPFIRARIGDTGAVPLSPNTMLDLFIVNALVDDQCWRLNAKSQVVYQEGPTDAILGRTITPDWVDGRDKAIMFYEAALVTVAISRINTGHRAGKIDVRRGQAAGDLTQWIQARIREIKYGAPLVSGTSEWYGMWLKGTPQGIAQIMSFPG